jgi:hypothetical protein
MLRNFKSPLGLRILLGVLLAANLAAAGIWLFPPGGSAADLENELANLQQQAVLKRTLVAKTRQHVAAVELGRAEGDEFLGTYFMNRRAAPEILLGQLEKAAAGSKIKSKEASVSTQPIDGSDSLSMMSITANYEGTYQDLLHFVHELDQSSTLLIIQSLNAAPVSGTPNLSVSMKLDTFVREDGGAGSI